MTVRVVQGGVLFRVRGALHFLPASIAIKAMPIPEMARVPGGPPELCGVALVDGDMIPVLDVGPLRPAAPGARPGGAMLVCAILGERLGLVGVEVVATGRFEVDPASGELAYGGETAHAFDVGGLVARVREGRWAV